MKKPWEIGLSEYVGLSPVEDLQVDSLYKNLDDLRSLDLSIRTSGHRNIRSDHQDYFFRLSDNGHIGVYHAGNGRIVGGYLPIYPYVMPAHRGHRLGAQMNVIMDDAGHRRPANIYSVSGFNSRVSAHRLHLVRALKREERVPFNVLDEYVCCSNGHLALRNPYKPEDHNAWCKQRRHKIRREMIEAQTRNYLERFQKPEDVRLDHFNFYCPSYAGYLLSVAIHRMTGARFLLHKSPPDKESLSPLSATGYLPAFTIQSEIDGMVIDAEGIRPTSFALEDLRKRGLASHGKILVCRIATEAELINWLGPAIPDAPGHILPELSRATMEEALESRPGRRILESGFIMDHARVDKPDSEFDYGL